MIRCIRFLVFFFLLLLVLGAGAYLLRWPLFGGLIRSGLAEALSAALDGTVEIDGLSGSLFTGIRCRGLRVSAADEDVQLREASVEDVCIQYNPIRLFQGDLSALTVGIKGGFFAVDLDRPGKPRDELRIEPFTLPEHLPAVDISSVDLVLHAKETTLRLNGLGLSVEDDGGEGRQQGCLSAEWIACLTPHGEVARPNLHCPIRYTQGRISVESLRLGDAGDVINAYVALSEVDGSEIEAELEGRVLGGTLRFSARSAIAENVSFEAGFELIRVDLARIGAWMRMLTGTWRPLQGDLLGSGTLRGLLNDFASLEMESDLRLDGGRYGETDLVDVNLIAGLKDEIVHFEHCVIRSGPSTIRLLDGRVPFQEGRPALEGATARVEIELPDAEQWLRKAGVDTDRYPLVQGAELNGRGRIAGRRLVMDRVEVGLDQGSAEFDDLSVSQAGESIRSEIGGFRGRISEKEFELMETARMTFSSTGAEVADLNLRIGDGTVVLNGRLLEDLSVDAHARVTGLKREQVLDLLPLENQELPLEWNGLELDVDLAGGMFDLSGNLRCALENVQYADFRFQDLALTARLTPDRFDVEKLNARVPEGGLISITAGWDLEFGNQWALPGAIEGFVEVENLNLSVLEATTDNLQGAEGALSLSLKVQGSPFDPHVNLTTEGTLKALPACLASRVEGKLQAKVPLDFDIKASREQDAVLIEALHLTSKDCTFSAKGRLPLSLDLAAEDPALALDLDGPVEAELNLSQLDLAPFSKLGGLVSVEALFKGPLGYPEGSFRVETKGIMVPELGPHDLVIEGGLKEGRLQADPMTVTCSDRVVASGRAALDLNGAEGSRLSLPGPGTRIETAMAISNLDLAPLATAFGLSAAGMGSITLEGDGLLEDPCLVVQASIEKGTVALPEVDDMVEDTLIEYPFSIQARLTAGGELVRVDEAIVRIAGGTLSGSGTVPLGLGYGRFTQGNLVDRHAPLSATLESSSFDLESLSRLFKTVRRIQGVLTGQARVGGTLTSPEFLADLHLSGGSIRTASRLSSLENIEGHLRVAEDELRIVRLDGEMGAGPFQIEGGIPLEGFTPRAFDLRVKGNNTLLYRGSGFRVRADLDLELKGPADSPKVAGNVVLRDSRFVKRIPLLANSGPPPVEKAGPPFSLTDSFSRNLVFDVAIKTEEGDAVQVKNNLAQGDVELDLALKGTGQIPYFQGVVVFDRMVISLPNFRFLVDSGRIEYTALAPYTPTLECVAHGRRQSIDVDLIARGPLDDPEVTLISSPPMDYDDLVVLVSTGLLPDTLQRRGVESEALKQVGLYLGKELYHEFFGSETTESGEAFFDRIELNIGSEVGQSGTENILFEYHVEGPWYVQLEQDIYRDWNSGVVYRIRFR